MFVGERTWAKQRGIVQTDFQGWLRYILEEGKKVSEDPVLGWPPHLKKSRRRECLGSSMPETTLDNTSVTAEERYRMLRSSLAHYLLLQVGTFIDGMGQEAVAPAMEILTQKSADLKVRKIKEKGSTGPEDAMVAISRNLEVSMGETFKSDYGVTESDSSRTVTLRECGCIKSIVDISDEYGLSSPRARSIFCGACMNSYRKATTILELGFQGQLSKEGCFMKFSTK